MDKNRRSILKAIGLTTVGTALSTDDMALAGQPAQGAMPAFPHPNMKDGVASALEALAQAIRDGEAEAQGLKVTSELRPDSFIEHDLHIRVVLVRDTE